jgi:hypothetical protein
LKLASKGAFIGKPAGDRNDQVLNLGPLHDLRRRASAGCLEGDSPSRVIVGNFETKRVAQWEILSSDLS